MIGVSVMDLSAIVFTINGLLGGLTCALLHAKNFNEILTYTSIRAIVLGAIAGYLYLYMFTEWNLPNSAMAFIFGYSFKDMLDSLYEKAKILQYMKSKT